MASYAIDDDGDDLLPGLRSTPLASEPYILQREIERLAEPESREQFILEPRREREIRPLPELRIEEENKERSIDDRFNFFDSDFDFSVLQQLTPDPVKSMSQRQDEGFENFKVSDSGWLADLPANILASYALAPVAEAKENEDKRLQVEDTGPVSVAPPVPHDYQLGYVYRVLAGTESMTPALPRIRAKIEDSLRSIDAVWRASPDWLLYVCRKMNNFELLDFRVLFFSDSQFDQSVNEIPDLVVEIRFTNGNTSAIQLLEKSLATAASLRRIKRSADEIANSVGLALEVPEILRALLPEGQGTVSTVSSDDTFALKLENATRLVAQTLSHQENLIGLRLAAYLFRDLAALRQGGSERLHVLEPTGVGFKFMVRVAEIATTVLDSEVRCVALSLLIEAVHEQPMLMQVCLQAAVGNASSADELTQHIAAHLRSKCV